MTPTPQITDTATPDRARLLADLQRQHERLDAQGRILQLLPEDILARVTLGLQWLQISSLNREEVERTFRALAAGHWERTPTNDGRLEYNAYVQGVRVCIYGAEPPASCRIEIEEIEVPAHKEIRKTLVCK